MVPVVETARQDRVAKDQLRWYAVHTMRHREFGAAKQLEFQSFDTFLPLVLKTVRHARRFRTVAAPFFPNYLFVRLNLSRDRWRSVNGTFGVSSLIMEGERPKPVPVGVVEAIHSTADVRGHLKFGPLGHVGQKVRILTGPFADRVGELLHADEQGRVQILLEMMGAGVVVDTRGSALSALS